MIQTLGLKFVKYFEIAKIVYRTQTAYLRDVIGVAAVVGMRVWIFTQLYHMAFLAAGTSLLGGFNFAQTIWILAFTQSFHVSNRNRTQIKSIEYDIQSGTVAYSISRPYSYLLFNFFTSFGTIGGYLFITMVFSLTAAIIFVGVVKISPIGIISGAILLLFGFSLNALMVLIIGLATFWAEDISAFRWIYDKMLWIFGGIFLPLSLFPQKFQAIVELLPFNQMYYGPARMIIGFDAHIFYKYLGIQVIWIIILSLICVLMYRKGTKSLSINGG